MGGGFWDSNVFFLNSYFSVNTYKLRGGRRLKYTLHVLFAEKVNYFLDQQKTNIDVTDVLNIQNMHSPWVNFAQKDPNTLLITIAKQRLFFKAA